MKSKLFISLLIIGFLTPSALFAAEFRMLVGIPGVDVVGGGLNQYINALYRLSISIAALLAVIKIIAAGAKYMLTDIVPAKEEAKKDIQGALIGLLIVIGAIVILNTINTDLTNVNFDLETLPINDRPLTGPEGELRRLCGTDNSTCTIQVCTDSQNRLPGISEFLPGGSGASCQDDCNNADGFVFRETANGAIRCAVSNERLAELMVGSSCGGNSQQCSVLSCEVYGADYNTCPGACSGINGVYTSNGQTCLVRNGATESITCTGATSGGGGRGGGAAINQGGFCQSARDDCYDRSGYVTAATDTTVTCSIPRDLAAEAEAAEEAAEEAARVACDADPTTQWDSTRGCVPEGYVDPIL
ncbi:MAG: pilin [Patescibacteria group bacterium]